MEEKYNSYSAYKSTNDIWISEIPDAWSLVELKRYSHVMGGYAFNSDSFVDAGTAVIRIGDIKKDGSVSLDTCKYISDQSISSFKQYTVRKGDLLMAMTGATIGKAGWYTSNEPALLNQRVGAFRYDQSNLHYRFYWYVLNSLGYQEYIQLTAFGGAQPNISDSGMVGYKTALPKLLEQKKIASFLDHETAKIDTLIEKQQQLIKLLKEKRQAVISHTVTKGLNPNAPMKASGVEWLEEVPEHWNLSSLKYYWKVLDCKHVTAEFVDEGIPLASIREVKSWYVDLKNAKKTTEAYYDLLIDGNRKPNAGDIIYSRNATVGEAALVPSNLKFAMGQDVCLLSKISAFNSEFLLHQLKSPVIQLQLESLLIGSTFKRINVEEIRNFMICIPPVEEQNQIVLHLRDRVSRYDKLINKSEDAIELMRERRIALISAAVTGKIDVRNWQSESQSAQANAS